MIFRVTLSTSQEKPMDWLTFISTVVADGAWPLALSVIAYFVSRMSGHLGQYIDTISLPRGAAIKFRDGHNRRPSVARRPASVAKKSRIGSN